ncbi:peptidase S41, partial [Acidobacteria bacterium AH-259-O06]|nr:peptidase S41 [Acidobacteria bacterium AH-259-O06]
MSLLRVNVLCLGLAALLVLVAPTVSAQTKLLRFPDIHGDKVVFSYAGDLWLASSSGGSATRLTGHPGQELFAKFSPDGQWIAFTGQYDGDEQVYVIPTAGGVPQQLTYYPARGPLSAQGGYDNRVIGWTRDGRRVVFGSLRDSWARSRLYTVPVEGGLPEPLPMPTSGAGAFSPNGKRIVYSPQGMRRDFRMWKRYEGGWHRTLYVFDLATSAAEQITNHPRNDRDPMWIGDKIYFASDRDGTLNLYVYNISSKQTKQLTHSTKWDVRWPSADEQGQIVYELGGELEVFDVRSGKVRRLSIQVPDDGLSKRPSQISAEQQIEDWGLSPTGDRALFLARGDIFTVSIENGSTRNLTNSSNAHDRWARWSPDGRKIAFVSDRSGEEEIYLINPDSSGEPKQLTTGGRAMRYVPEWAPDGKRLAFSDTNGKLYVLTLEDRKVVEIVDERLPARDYAWSPNGGHLAFSLAGSNNLRSIYIWSVSDGQRHRITSEMFHELSPAWDPEGDYLYY